jgi:hypothetical protein
MGVKEEIACNLMHLNSRHSKLQALWALSFSLMPVAFLKKQGTRDENPSNAI